MRKCRLCNGSLDLIINLGTQCLSGQFPAAHEPDPPAFPLEFCRCASCGLAQLSETVKPELMFADYWYRSGVTATMRNHLLAVANEAAKLHGEPRMVLDIGCNDGTLLGMVDVVQHSRCYEDAGKNIGIDPSNQASLLNGPIHGPALIHGAYPQDMMRVKKFNLIFSLACFYDIDDPLAFMDAIRKDLHPNGLWCIEVAHLPAMLRNGTFDAICHEHLTYWSACQLAMCMRQAGLKMVWCAPNAINGGSIRCYACREECTTYDGLKDSSELLRLQAEDLSGDCYAALHCLETRLEWNQPERFEDFAINVESLKNFEWWNSCIGKQVHLLGASTKSNVFLQYMGLNFKTIEVASDRDPRKHGRMTPKSRIPIISEAESRAMNPDAYLCLLYGFKDEIMQREKAYLNGGGKIIFPFQTEMVLCR